MGLISLMIDDKPPISIAPTPRNLILVFHIIQAAWVVSPSHPYILEYIGIAINHDIKPPVNTNIEIYNSIDCMMLYHILNSLRNWKYCDSVKLNPRKMFEN